MILDKTKNYKIRVTPEQSRRIQQYLFDHNIASWSGDKSIRHEEQPFLYINNGRLLHGSIESTFIEYSDTEITPEQILNDDKLTKLFKKLTGEK